MLKFLYGVSRFPLMQEAGAEGGAGGGGDNGGGSDNGSAGGQQGGAQGGDKGTQGSGDKGTGDQGGAKGAGDAGNGDSLLDGVDDEGDGSDTEDKGTIDFTKGKPENFPDAAWDDKEKKPKADVLFDLLSKEQKRVADLRAKMGKGDHKAPKDPKEYTFKPTEKGLKAFKDGNPMNDPVVAAVAPIAHKHGLSKEQYAGLMADISDVLVDMAEKRDTNQQEMTDEQKAEIRKQEYEKIGTNAVQIIKAVESWGRELKSTGQFSESDIAAFKSMAVTGDQVRVLNKLRALAGGGNSLPMDFSNDGLPSDEEIADLQANVKTEADQRKVDQMYEKRRLAGRPEKLQIRA